MASGEVADDRAGGEVDEHDVVVLLERDDGDVVVVDVHELRLRILRKERGDAREVDDPGRPLLDLADEATSREHLDAAQSARQRSACGGRDLREDPRAPTRARMPSPQIRSKTTTITIASTTGTKAATTPAASARAALRPAMRRERKTRSAPITAGEAK